MIDYLVFAVFWRVFLGRLFRSDSAEEEAFGSLLLFLKIMTTILRQDYKEYCTGKYCLTIYPEIEGTFLKIGRLNLTLR